MDIKIRKPYKTILPFELTGLPDLVALTGENGTGKTQLLEYLYYGSRLNEKGNVVSISEEEENFSEMPNVHLPLPKNVQAKLPITGGYYVKK